MGSTLLGSGAESACTHEGTPLTMDILDLPSETMSGTCICGYRFTARYDEEALRTGNIFVTKN